MCAKIMFDHKENKKANLQSEGSHGPQSQSTGCTGQNVQPAKRSRQLSPSRTATGSERIKAICRTLFQIKYFRFCLLLWIIGRSWISAPIFIGNSPTVRCDRPPGYLPTSLWVRWVSRPRTSTEVPREAQAKRHSELVGWKKRRQSHHAHA